MANELKFGNKVVFLNGLPLTLPVAASDPGSAVAGDMYYNSASNAVKYYNGSVWSALASGGAAASTALDNLASVAINTALLPDTDASIDFGSATFSWLGAYINQLNAADASISVDVYGRALQDDAAANQLEWSASGVALPQLTATTVPYLNGSKILVSSAVTPTELGYVSGVTSAIQTQLTSVTNKANDLITLSGVAANATSLGTFTGTIIPDTSTVKAALQSLETYVGALPDPMEYKGLWDASTNTPTLADGAGNNGDLYQVSAAGTVDFGAGNISFDIGDKVVYSGTTGEWEKWDMTDSVSSVNGSTGAVTVNAINQLSGEATTSAASGSQSLAVTLSNSAVIGKVLTGFSAGAGTVAATDTILQAFQKLAGNDALYLPLAGGTMTGTITSQSIVPSAASTYNLGASGNNYSNAYINQVNTGVVNRGNAGTLTIQTSTSASNIAINTANAGVVSINANGVGTFDVMATKLRRSVNGADTTNFMEDQYFDALTLAANTSSATEISASLSFALASFDAAIIEYRIKEASSNKTRVGQFIVTTDGTVASSSDQFTESAALGAALGLSLSADIDSGNVRILFNNTHASNACTMRCNIRRLRA